MAAYYNEFDPYAAQWLRNLIAAGHIAPGDVDERSITDVQPDDLAGYDQCHFFAGIGGWSLAARLAGWPDDRPLWTGSCPCQPHSAAAADRRKGFADPRDLWPVWLRLIKECVPDAVAGEQVDDTVAWIDRAITDLEAAGYAVGSVDLPASAVDAPHERVRHYFVAHPDCAGRGEQGGAVPVDPEFMAVERDGCSSRFGDYRTAGEAGRYRRVEPGIRLLAHGVPARVGKLRAYGNAIVPEVAAEVIGAYLDSERLRLTTPAGVFA